MTPLTLEMEIVMAAIMIALPLGVFLYYLFMAKEQQCPSCHWYDHSYFKRKTCPRCGASYQSNADETTKEKP